MNIPQKLINSIKQSYKSVRVANFHPTGILATRVLVLIMLVPILLVVTQYVMSFISKLINVGINIIDHIFIPSVLTAIVGFLGLWVDRNNNGIPDRLEEEDKR